MTKQEKIDILWKMMWLNFRLNFNRPKTLRCFGLCSIIQLVTNFKYNNLETDIPEILSYRNDFGTLHWWSYKGRFIPWWERHKAIWKTIRQLKKS